MYLIVHIFILLNLVLSPIITEETPPQTSNLQLKLKITIANLFQSFRNFSENIRKYFSLPIQKLEERKEKIKNKFHKFIDEPILEDISPITNENNEPDFERLQPVIFGSEMIIDNGYRVEIHTVQTKDGYHLILHRIPSTSVNKNVSKIALLHHGLLGCADDWLILGRKKALPFLMSDAGYDVWMANARGNRYSKTHVRQPAESSSSEFWNFSWHEIGHYDLSAVVNYIRDVTNGSARIDFVGYSMGATALLVLLTTLPQYNVMFRSAVLLGPLSYMHSSRGPLRYLATLTEKEGVNALNFLGKNEYMRTEKYPKEILKKFCAGDEELCSNPLLFLANGGQSISNTTLRKIILDHVPAGGSTKIIVHYCQLLKSGNFQMFDFGTAENAKRYGAKTPPGYRLNDVTVPVAVFTASSDWLSTTADALSLVPHLPFAAEHHVIQHQGFSHTDFVFSKHATKLVYCKVLYMLDTLVPDRPKPTFRRTSRERDDDDNNVCNFN